MKRKLWSNGRWELWSDGLCALEFSYFIPMSQLRDLYEGYEDKMVSRWLLHMGEKSWVASNLDEFVEAFEQGLRYVEGNQIDVSYSLKLHHDNKTDLEQRYVGWQPVKKKVIEFT